MNKERNYKPTALNADDIRRLTERFLSGETSPAEERAIYAFYASNSAGSLPDDLERLRPMFAWYDSISAPIAEPAVRKQGKRMWYAGVAAAAGLLIILCGALVVNRMNRGEVNPMYAAYDGSYIVREGVRTSDLNVIFSALTAAEALADSLDRVADRELNLDGEYERRAIDAALAGISDRALAEQLRRELLDDPS